MLLTGTCVDCVLRNRHPNPSIEWIDLLAQGFGLVECLLRICCDFCHSVRNLLALLLDAVPVLDSFGAHVNATETRCHSETPRTRRCLGPYGRGVKARLRNICYVACTFAAGVEILAGCSTRYYVGGAVGGRDPAAQDADTTYRAPCSEGRPERTPQCRQSFDIDGAEVSVKITAELPEASLDGRGDFAGAREAAVDLCKSAVAQEELHRTIDGYASEDRPCA